MDMKAEAVLPIHRSKDAQAKTFGDFFHSKVQKVHPEGLSVGNLLDTEPLCVDHDFAGVHQEIFEPAS